jgi:hypothetical protein
MTDTELLDAIEGNEWALDFTGEAVTPWRILLGFDVRLVPNYVYGDTLREVVQAALARREVPA